MSLEYSIPIKECKFQFCVIYLTYFMNQLRNKIPPKNRSALTLEQRIEVI